ncbi:hypothetical protein ACQEVG_37710 [Streptomyces sp. CA-135486]|uniref:hypothetical protein n=1 Tax=Streptomyces sp. CA-135486 TaxID=3240049 RepID=UPI003D8F571C
MQPAVKERRRISTQPPETDSEAQNGMTCRLPVPMLKPMTKAIAQQSTVQTSTASAM